VRRYFLEMYSYTTHCVSDQQCLVAGHLVSVGMIMRIVTMVSLFSLPVALSKLFESATSHTYRQLKFWNRRHDTEIFA
jgi:hypothetical protein